MDAQLPMCTAAKKENGFETILFEQDEPQGGFGSSWEPNTAAQTGSAMPCHYQPCLRPLQVSWNAATPCVQSETKALGCALRIAEGLTSQSLTTEFSMGLGAGACLVGNLGCENMKVCRVTPSVQCC